MDPTSDEHWELRHDDDGFTYKILKRQRLADPTPPPQPDPDAEEGHRRDRKKKTLLKLKAKYQKEIDQWEILSNSLSAIEERTNLLQKRHQEMGTTVSLLELDSVALKEAEDGFSESLIDELIWKVEAQEAIIRDVSNLCDVAEAMCNTQQEQLVKSFIDLPVWSSSPRELMASLCDE